MFSKLNQDQKRIVAYSIPIVLILIISLPRLFDAHFGFFDDAVTLITSNKILRGEWSPGDEALGGRFRPLYWLYYAFFYVLFGERPLYFFLGNTLVLILITLCIMKVVSYLSKKSYISVIAGVLFVISGPVLENVYTLSKPELQQTMWIMFSIVILGIIGISAKARFKILALIGVGITVFFATLSKETTPVLIPISLGWVVVATINRRFSGSISSQDVNYRLVYFFGCLLGVALYFLLRGIYVPFHLFEQGQANDFVLSFDRLIRNGLEWRNLLNRDYLYIFFLGIVPFIYWFKTKFKDTRIFIEIGIWLALWLVIYIPWRYVLEYYLLPFSVGAAILGGLLIERNQSILVDTALSIRTLGRSVFVFGLFLVLLTIPNNFTNARLQLTVDRVNQQVLDKVVETLPAGTPLLVNIHELNEYVSEIDLWLREIKGRGDVKVFHYTPEVDELLTDKNTNLYVLTPVLENWFYPSVRMGVNDVATSRWNDHLTQIVDGNENLEYENIQSFRLLNIDAARLICPLFQNWKYCNVPNTPVDSRILFYGWKLYSIN
jgi:hypothetical protein